MKNNADFFLFCIYLDFLPRIKAGKQHFLLSVFLARKMSSLKIIITGINIRFWQLQQVKYCKTTHWYTHRGIKIHRDIRY